MRSGHSPCGRVSNQGNIQDEKFPYRQNFIDLRRCLELVPLGLRQAEHQRCVVIRAGWKRWSCPQNRAIQPTDLPWLTKHAIVAPGAKAHFLVVVMSSVSA